MGTTPKILSTIIGIDNYDCRKIPNLSGCVNDAMAMWDLLTGTLNVPPDQIKLLLSTDPPPSPGRSEQLVYEKPTRANIDESLKWLKKETNKAKEETRDVVIFIHFSGHGARLKTQYAHRENDTGLDEALVPMDFPNGQLLRDVAFGDHLDALSYFDDTLDIQEGRRVEGQQPHVFAVLDCCHSGGATRTFTLTPNDTSAYSTPSDETNTDHTDTMSRYLDIESISAALEYTDTDRTCVSRGGFNLETNGTSASDGLHGSDTGQYALEDEIRGFTVGDEANSEISRSFWKEKATPYTVITACQPNEFAREINSAPGVRNGRLTHALLEIIKSMGEQALSTTYQRLLHQLRVKFSHKYTDQNPMLSGNGQKTFFGIARKKFAQTPYEGAIVKVNETTNPIELTIDIGKAHNVHIGDEYHVHALNLSEADTPSHRLCVRSVHELTSTADLISIGDTSFVAPGCWLSMSSRAKASPFHVALVSPPSMANDTLNVFTANDAMKVLQENWPLGGFLPKTFTGTAGCPGNSKAKYQVDVDAHDAPTCYIIQDESGRPLPNIQPLPISAGSEARRDIEAKRVVQTIQHITQYDLVESLRRDQPQGSFQVFSLNIDGETGSPNNRTIRVKDGGLITIGIKNNRKEPPSPHAASIMTNTLYVYYFNLNSRYGVKMFKVGEPEFEIVEPQKEIFVKLRMFIPESVREDHINDVIKVIVTASKTHFELLEQDDLDKVLKRDFRSLPTDDDALRHLFEGLLSKEEWLSMRDVDDPPKVEMGDWWTDQAVITVYRDA